METTIRKKLTPDEMAELFISDKISVKFYKCIGDFCEVGKKNTYDITIRHAEDTSLKSLEDIIAKVLCYKNPLV